MIIIVLKHLIGETILETNGHGFGVESLAGVEQFVVEVVGEDGHDVDGVEGLSKVEQDFGDFGGGWIRVDGIVDPLNCLFEHLRAHGLELHWAGDGNVQLFENQAQHVKQVLAIRTGCGLLLPETLDQDFEALQNPVG